MNIFNKYPNFRDIGGVLNKKGVEVSKGLIYRSEFFENFDENDVKDFEDLEINTVIDLRTEEEFQLIGSNEYPDFIEYKNIVINSGNIAKELIPIFVEGTLEKLDPDIMLKVYLAIVKDSKEELIKVFETLFDPGKRSVYHCSHGKDRTGVISALLQDLLDVDRDRIMKDYLISNELNKAKIGSQIEMIKGGFMAKFGRELDEGENTLIKRLFYCDPAYLKLVFEFVDDHYGSTDNYFKEFLGISEADLSDFRTRLTN